MQKAFYQALLIALLFVSCTSFSKQEELTLSERIDQEITGELAYQTTGYVEQYWRVVGNAGFDSSIYQIVRKLEKSGFVEESSATTETRLTYRIETRPLKKPTWEPVTASIQIVGDTTHLLRFEDNRNMIAINSFSTPPEGVMAEVVHIKDLQDLSRKEVEGKIVFAESHPYHVYRKVTSKGAIGIITYNNPPYLQPAKNTTSIQFRSIPLDPKNRMWAIPLSYEAKERLTARLNAGKTELKVFVDTKIYESEELTVIAEVRGEKCPKERLVFSAHVQEPGANDNATGVGVALEMADATAKLLSEGHFSPHRTLTFLWGDEIISTNRYVVEDSMRAKQIKWGISLDMVGENTEVTGGTFLIEKMPDPSAIWTRGKDKHTEWGAANVTLEDIKPHYLNDFVINRFEEQGQRANWMVKTNPYEGGSDHIPFLKGDIPAVLFWHFTDQFYHTDNDRLDKVSKTTLKNVGTAALISASMLLNADAVLAQQVIEELTASGKTRLQDEFELSRASLADTSSLESELKIIQAWKDWYTGSLETCKELSDDKKTVQLVVEAQEELSVVADELMEQLEASERVE